MATKTLDFNAFTPPTFEIVMKDPERTKIRVTLPSEKLAEELKDAADALALSQEGDEAVEAELFEYAAKLISYNRDRLTVTGDELRGKYGLTTDELIGFFSVYADFVNDIINLKN